MKTLMTVVAAVLAATTFADGPAPQRGGQPGRFGGRGFGGGMGFGAMGDPIMRVATNPKIAEKIGLSEDQKAKLKEATGDQSKTRELQKQVMEKTEHQMQLMKAEKIDEAAVMSAIDEVFEARKEIAKQQTKQLIAIRSILTPEQIEKAKNAMEEVRAKRGNGNRGEGLGPRGEGRGPRGEGRGKKAGAPAGDPE